MKQVMIMWGNPVDGFKIAGPYMPNTWEIEHVTEVFLDSETWWHVPIIDPSDIIREG